MSAKRVLTVDDEVSFTNLVKLNLERTDRFQVQVANNPFTALAIARTFQPHVILLDILMPGRDGVELIQNFQADAELRKIPVIFLTASMVRQVAAAQQATQSGLPVIAKPVDPKELIRQIDLVLKTSFFDRPMGWGPASSVHEAQPGL